MVSKVPKNLLNTINIKAKSMGYVLGLIVAGLFIFTALVVISISTTDPR